jgi:hypothetical protein
MITSDLMKKLVAGFKERPQPRAAGPHDCRNRQPRKKFRPVEPDCAHRAALIK